MKKTIFLIVILIVFLLGGCRTKQTGVFDTSPSATPVSTVQKSQVQSDAASPNELIIKSIDHIRFFDFINESHGWAVVSKQKPAETGWHWSDHQLLQTKDGGENWTEVAKLNFRDITHLDFINEKKGWIGTPGGLFVTDDGGVHW